VPKQLETSRLIESVVRLRRAERAAGDAVRSEIEPVLSHLEEAVGPTVSRAQAARLLGVSQTALDRWIDKRDIPAVVTPNGRREIPLSQLVDLLDEVERQDERGRLALASVIHDRRRRAESIDAEEILPARRRRIGTRDHRPAELRSLAYHRVVARRLDEGIVNDARKRLRRWREDGRIDPRWADEWERILAMPPPSIAKLMSSDSERARALRQSSPFAGVLTEQERRRLLEAIEERTSA